MSKVSDLRRSDRRTAMKALVKKGFKFVALLWAMYVEQNKADMRYDYNVYVYVRAFDM